MAVDVHRHSRRRRCRRSRRRSRIEKILKWRSSTHSKTNKSYIIDYSV